MATNLVAHNNRDLFSHSSEAIDNFVRSQEIGITGPGSAQQGHTPSRGSRGEFVPCSFQLLVAASLPWVVVASLPSLNVSAEVRSFPLYMSNLLCLLLLRTFVMAFRTHPDYPGQSSYFKILRLITSARPFFQIE